MKNWKENKQHVIKSIFHIFIIAPLLLFIGFYHPTNDIYYYLLFLFGIIIIIRFVMNWINKSLYTFLYIHTFVIAPLLIYISYLHFYLPSPSSPLHNDKYSSIPFQGSPQLQQNINKNRNQNENLKIQNIYYYLLIFIGFSALLYHLQKLFYFYF